MSYKKFYVVRALHDFNKYFVFRPINDKDCIEIEIIIMPEIIKGWKQLKKEEQEHFTNVIIVGRDPNKPKYLK